MADNHSGRSKMAESFAFSLARKYNSRFFVADVLEDHDGRVVARVSQFERRDCKSMSANPERNQTNLPQSTSDIGTQSELILDEAESSAADLIVLTVPAAHWSTNRFLSTNSYQVVCGAPCPALTVRAE